jgi:hypothetical protein
MTATPETKTEEFEVHLNEYKREDGVFSFSLQLEEDFEIYSEFEANMKFTAKLVSIQNQTEAKQRRVPQDHKSERAKAAEDKAAQKTASELLGFIMYVFGEDGFDELVDYYSEKNVKERDLTSDDFMRILVAIITVIAPKAGGES